jgi:hypothetical protein
MYMQQFVNSLCQSENETMRKIFFITCLLSFLSSRAQVQVYMNGGINNTQIPITKNAGSGIKQNEGGNSWQAGGSMVLSGENKGFFYTGLRYENKNFHKAQIECCTLYKDAQYQLQYISLPIGGGYQVPVSKSTNLQFSGGAYISMGVSGSAEGNQYPYTSSVPLSQMSMDPHFEEKVNFQGNKAEFAKWQWGLETGISANWKKIAVQFRYQFGLNNILPANPDSEMRYRTATLDLGYRLFSSKK